MATSTGAGMIAFLAGLAAGWSVEDGLVGALQVPISTNLLGGADLSWLFGIDIKSDLCTTDRAAHPQAKHQA